MITIKLKGYNNIADMSEMFFCCTAFSLPGISKRNIPNACFVNGILFVEI